MLIHLSFSTPFAFLFLFLFLSRRFRLIGLSRCLCLFLMCGYATNALLYNIHGPRLRLLLKNGRNRRELLLLRLRELLLLLRLGSSAKHRQSRLQILLWCHHLVTARMNELLSMFDLKCILTLLLSTKTILFPCGLSSLSHDQLKDMKPEAERFLMELASPNASPIKSESPLAISATTLPASPQSTSDVPSVSFDSRLVE